jgi:polyisoprenoid-binding protein YceI
MSPIPMKTPLLALALTLLLAPLAHAIDVPLVVDKTRSRIEFNVKATMDSFTGQLTAYELELLHDPSAPGKISRAEIRFRFGALKTGNEKRDAEMYKWQSNEQFPECVFTLTALEPAATPDHYTARGQLLLHGTARDLIFPVTISTTADNSYLIKGEARIDTRDFGLPVIRKFMLLKVDPVVVVGLHLEARAASAR